MGCTFHGTKIYPVFAGNVEYQKSLSLVLVGTHFRGTGASDQMITCGQSTDTSTKHDHSPAHCKA